MVHVLRVLKILEKEEKQGETKCKTLESATSSLYFYVSKIDDFEL